LTFSAIVTSYRGEKGEPPYHPATMVAKLLLLCAYAVDTPRAGSPRRVATVDLMAIVVLQRPDFRTIAEFRRRHLAALSAPFVQVLKLCERAGLVKLGDRRAVSAHTSHDHANVCSHLTAQVAPISKGSAASRRNAPVSTASITRSCRSPDSDFDTVVAPTGESMRVDWLSQTA
jgi:hypothetical protein